MSSPLIRMTPSDGCSKPAIILSNVAVYASVIGQSQQAIDLTRESISRDPISPVAWSNLSGQYMRAGRYNDALAAADKALEQAGTFSWERAAELAELSFRRCHEDAKRR